MNNKKMFELGLRRFIIVFVISLVLVGVMGEVANAWIGSSADRGPQAVELIIPAGTAEKLASGQEEPAIPDSMTFVVGDTLVVRNQDVVDHQLGPVWVPAGSSASLKMDTANSYDYTCSFRASNYLGMDIKEATTIGIRLISLGYVAPATALFLFVYSLVLFPLKPKETVAQGS